MSTSSKPLTAVVLIRKCIYEEDVRCAIEGLKNELAFREAAGTYNINPVSIVDKWFPIFKDRS